MFATGVAELESVFQLILSPSTLAELHRIARLGEEEFQLPCGIVGQDSLRVCRRVSEICDKSRPYYSGPGAAFPRESLTFLIENRDGSADDVESNIEGLCLEFERLKPYLLRCGNRESEATMREMIISELTQALHELARGFAHFLPRLIVMLILHS